MGWSIISKFSWIIARTSEHLLENLFTNSSSLTTFMHIEIKNTNWLYFFNSPNYVASNSTVMTTATKSINVITSENDQEFTDKTFTFGLYESQTSNTPLATEEDPTMMDI